MRDGLGGQIVNRAEWRWVVLMTLAVLLLVSIPYVVAAWRAEQAGVVFSGFVIGVEDGNSYLAKMRQGAQGHWLFQLVFTSEPHERVLVYSFYILLGKASALLQATGAPGNLTQALIIGFHLARLLCSGALLLVTYRFVSTFVAVLWLRRLAWTMVAVGGGLGWILLAFGKDNWLGSPPIDMILPEGFTFLTLLLLPHIALARTCLLLGFLRWLEGDWLIAGIFWFVMVLIVPFSIAVIVTVSGMAVLFHGVRKRRVAVHEIRHAGLALVAPCATAAYYAWMFLTDPVMRGWSEQNLTPSPHVLHYVMGYAIPGFLALLGMRWVHRTASGLRYWMLMAWVTMVPVLLYVPFSLQRRLLEGYQLPLYTLAALAIERELLPRFGCTCTGERRLKALVASVLALMVPTSVVLLAGSTAAVLRAEPPLYHDPEQLSVAEWLSGNAAQGSVVLSVCEIGNFLPAWTPVRVYCGHGSETIEYEVKRANVSLFFSADADDSWREQLLRENNIRYVLAGQDDQGVTGGRLTENVYLRKAYQSPQWSLYSIEFHDQ